MSTLECVKCHGRSTLYLCKQCATGLRQQLLRMPTLVDQLTDTALGLTRLSVDNSRQLGFESRTPVFNDRASDLIAEIERVLGQWARPLAVKHGYVISPPITWARPISEYTHTSADYAVFLAAHVNDLANDEYVGELCGSLRQYIKRAVGDRDEGGLLNRRTPSQFCGPCPALITDHRHCIDCAKRDHQCANPLMARRGASEITCPRCGSQHRVEVLINHLLAHADDHRCTIDVLNQVLRRLGEPVNISTLYRWATPKVGLLKPAGYQRPDNLRIGPTRHSDQDKPVYRVSDARKQRAESMKPGRRGRPLQSEGKR